MKQEIFGNLSDGREAGLIMLKNKNGMIANLTNYGARIISLYTPDKHSKFDDIILGYDTIEEYEADQSCMGCIAGRYANRIAKGKFTIDGIEYQLDCNDGENHLHGGFNGFDKRLWNYDYDEVDNSVTFKIISEDADQNYPGELTVSVTYRLTDGNSLEISYEATTNKATIINLTNHAYFNLSGDFTKTIEDHVVTIYADTYTPVDDNSIPTGIIDSVKNTPFDFIQPKTISKDIDKLGERSVKGNGYDHNWVLNNYNNNVREVAKVFHDTSGRELTVLTDQPGLQFYTANFLDGSVIGKNGVFQNHRTGFCMEAQYFPDSPNHPHFPQAVLKPGEIYKQKTIYKFALNI